MLELTRVLKTYGERTVLDLGDQSFPPGRVHVIVGPNGSGKSTLLKILAMLLSPDEAQGSFENVPLPWGCPAGERRFRQRATYVAQDPYLFGGTVLANTAYGLRSRGLSRDAVRERALRELTRFGLSAFAGKPAAGLSQGERQRVALARAFTLDTPLLLLDEPIANVDQESVPLVEERIHKAVEEGATCLVATHETSQARRLGQGELLHLNEGVVVPGGRENVFTGTPKGQQDGEAVLLLPGGVPVLLPGVEPEGETRVVSIDPEDVLLSLSPLASSARNSFEGEVTALSSEGGLAWVTVDVGCPLVACITAHSLADLDLRLGSRVHASFKATAVHLL